MLKTESQPLAPLTMNNAASLMEPVVMNEPDGPSSVLRRGFVLSLCILSATAVLSGILYFSAKQNLRQRAEQVELKGGLGASEVNFELLQQIDRVALNVAVVAAAGSVGCLAPLLLVAMRAHRKLTAQLREQAQDRQTMASGFQLQVAELRRARDSVLLKQAELESSVNELKTEKTRLQEELDKRNRAERAFTQRRQELESSKSVLELHVQARTKELETLQRRTELILNSAGEGICGLDLEGKTTFVNPTVAHLTGWPMDELIGRTEQEIFFAGRNGHDQGRDDPPEQSLHEGGPDQALEARPGKAAAVRRDACPALPCDKPGERMFHRRDGTVFPVEFVKTALKEDGRVVGSVLMFKDITERKRVDETLAQKAAELARSNGELEQFAFVASHDLQEPLRKIQAFGDRLKVKCEGVQTPEIRDYLDRMQNAAARMRTLINDLLAFSRAIRSKEPFVTLELNQLAREVLGDLEVRIEKSGAKIEIESLPSIEADATQMRQLFLNLLSNSLKFQPPGAVPVIRVSGRTLTSVSGEALCELSFQDNGIGFDEKYLDKIFAVFQRLHGRTEYEGTGVGLAVCRRIVDRHHGSIIAHSRPGEGATFLVTLPMHQAKPGAGK